MIHVLVRTDAGIESITDLRGRRVAVGPQGSGSQATAELIFQAFDLPTDQVTREVTDWEKLFADDGPEAAIMSIGRGSRLVSRLLTGDRWRLLHIPRAVSIALDHPTLRPMHSGSARATGPRVRVLAPPRTRQRCSSSSNAG